jgi:predicted AlkP superfamily phosphohydrolase/phosphomutase
VIGGAIALAILLEPGVAHAYIGPGAGVAIAASGLAIVVSVLLAIVGLLLWPLRFLWRLVTRKRPPNAPRIRRAVVVGLDGLDPTLVRRYMDEDKLPNMRRLARAGTFRELGTTNPAMSPVAWSTFATGVNPGKHGIYDFLTRDPRTYRADLSSTDLEPPRRHLSIGDYRIPLGHARYRLLRKSKSFWQLLGRYRVPCAILRVPITFPPESFDGMLLSAMCVPDLQGTQGSFTYFSSAGDDGESIGGRQIAIQPDGDRVDLWLEGPPNPLRKDERRVRLRMRLEIDRRAGVANLHIGRREIPLRVGEYTDWVQVAFRLAPGFKLRGICRFRLLELEPHIRIYVTPINIDPERPILPISHPRLFATFLAKLNGSYATLGLAEDTWALNEGVLDEGAFLEQAWANHSEREAMFFEMLRRTRRGLVTCVFDGTDRIQHMFMRYLDEDHPALRGASADSPHRAAIEETYRRMDEMLGRVLDEVDVDDAENFVAIISDHGFRPFRRCVNLNSWLLERGYLALAEGRSESGEWFEGVDWSRTRAFALGLGGIYLNVKGRERAGTVEPEDAEALADQLAAELTGLVDDEGGKEAIRRAYPAHQIYRGPYTDEAPDVLVGYAAGWRASWRGARGIADATAFHDNTRAWSGDHCIDPELVPGVLIANHRLGDGDRQPEICDMAPTILTLFGVDAPRYMDGKSLCPTG